MYQTVKGNFILGQCDKAVVSFDVLGFLFKGPSLVKRNVKGMSDLSYWKHHLWKHPMPLGLEPKCCLCWSDLSTSLTMKWSIKPKKVTNLTETCVSLGPWDWVLNFITVFSSCIICTRWRGLSFSSAVVHRRGNQQWSDNDLQQWLKLRQILVEEILEFTCGLAFSPKVACK